VILHEAGDPVGEERVLNEIGDIYIVHEQYDQALEIYRELLMIARETDNWEGEMDTLCSIGDMYQHKDQYDMASEYFYKALDIAKEKEDDISEVILLEQIDALPKE
jgi:tetratricopeptide (TPR) repeat protein